jgi:predicted ferric reductase
MFFKSKIILGWSALALVNIIPIIIWLLIEPVTIRFLNLNSTLTSLGQIFGLLGFSLFATVIILSARLKFLENYFNGLNRIYINHHLLGGIAFILLLFHPLWLAAKYAVYSSYAAAIFLLPDLTFPAKSLGGSSLGLMIILLTITFYFSFKYHIWKISHKFLALAFVLGFIHMLLIPSDVSRHTSLRLYLIVLAIITFAVIIYRVMFSQRFVKKYRYSVIAVNKLSHDITEVAMQPVDESLPFRSGQFAFFSFITHGLSREAHPFSFISSPEETILKIAVKALGDFTGTFGDKLKIGASVVVEGPFGRFLGSGSKQIWLAGGIGVTPFLSMMKNISPDRQIDFYWSVQNEQEILWRSELELLALNQNNFNFFPHITSVSGYLNAEIVKSKSQNLLGKEIFICGPPAMMRSFKKQLINLGVDKSHIHSEEFSL